MNYIKKLCVLKQLSSGFASDGKKVSALLTAESFAGTLTFSLALIGFAPLREGRYVCLVCDEKGEREIFDVPSPSGCTVKRAANADISKGFCCLVCHVGTRVAPVAFGKCGDYTYDVKKLCALLDSRETPATAKKAENSPELADEREKSQTKAAPTIPPAPPDLPDPPYDDELVATENYYEFDREKDDERSTHDDKSMCDGSGQDVPYEYADRKEKECGESVGKDEDAQSLFRFASSEELAEDAQPCYYDKVKNELAALFGRYPAEEELAECIPFSKWAKVTFSRNKYYTVGVISDEHKPKYICYGVPAESRKDPPEALKGLCSFLPLSVFDLNGKGYWMMFQDAETGQCIKIAQK